MEKLSDSVPRGWITGMPPLRILVRMESQYKKSSVDCAHFDSLRRSRRVVTVEILPRLKFLTFLDETTIECPGASGFFEGRRLSLVSLPLETFSITNDAQHLRRLEFGYDHEGQLRGGRETRLDE